MTYLILLCREVIYSLHRLKTQSNEWSALKFSLVLCGFKTRTMLTSTDREGTVRDDSTEVKQLSDGLRFIIIAHCEDERLFGRQPVSSTD